MIRIITFSFLSLFFLCACAAPVGRAYGALETPGYFPDMEGWTKEPAPSVYDAETLYEYINGAADLYLDYDFRELSTLYYEKGESQGIAVDVYMHASPRDAFGIYSRERPTDTEFLQIGAQGYYEKGILNFVAGPYYVKLSGYSLGDRDEEVLKSLASGVAGRIDRAEGLPELLAAFPDSGLVEHSEGYVAVSFMGHGFLESAFVADYVVEGEELELFIIEADGGDAAQAMVESYVELAEKKGEHMEKDGSVYRFKDPFQSSKGAVNLKVHGKYVWGLLSDDAQVSEHYLKELEKGLKRTGLIR